MSETELRRRKFRRFKSVTSDSDKEEVKPVAKPELPDYNRSKTKKCHEERISLLTTGSEWENYSGFLNLLKVIVILANTRLFIDNLYNFGWQVHLIRPVLNMFLDPLTWTNLWVLVEIQIFAFMSLHIERLIARDIISVSTGKGCHVFNVALSLIAPIIQIMLAPSMPLPAFGVLIMAIVYFLKLWSYAHANRWYRDEAIRNSREQMRRRGSRRIRSLSVPSIREIDDEETKMVYPNNLTTSNLYYFLLCPSLCYEMQYPRTSNIRLDFLARRLLESIFLFWLVIAFVQQWILPHLQEVEERKHKSQIILLYEVLALAIPNSIIWLTSFILLFHSWLNFIAEFLMFADREFYRDWWNSQDTQYFWAAWNIPIHKWCVRHIYKPMLRSGFSKGFVAFSVFLFSAIFHEVIISVPLQRIRFYSALGMLFQVPMTPITKVVTKVFGPNYGNMLVWFQIIIGQPMGVLAYVTDWYLYT